VLNKLPGVNFQSADSFGTYEWSARITLRGFNQNQLGFTLDDIPLGDMSYANYNGLHISRAISAARSSSTPSTPATISAARSLRASGRMRRGARSSNWTQDCCPAAPNSSSAMSTRTARNGKAPARTASSR
jgi:hypothetical protein